MNNYLKLQHFKKDYIIIIIIIDLKLYNCAKFLKLSYAQIISYRYGYLKLYNFLEINKDRFYLGLVIWNYIII